MVESFNTPPTTIGTAIVLYSLGVSGLILLGAKLSQRFGAKLFFQAAVGMFLIAMLIMAASPAASFDLLGLSPSPVMILFNLLFTSAPKEFAGGVGSLRGVTQNLAAAVGTTVVGAMLVGLLSSMILTNVVDNPVIAAELKD